MVIINDDGKPDCSIISVGGYNIVKVIIIITCVQKRKGV